MRGGGRFVDLIFLKYPNRHENEIIWPNYFIFLLYLITGGGGGGGSGEPSEPPLVSATKVYKVQGSCNSCLGIQNKAICSDLRIFEQRHQIYNNVVCATSKGSD